MFLEEEKPFLTQLPATHFELPDWKQATVQFNYHISIEKMPYDNPGLKEVPFEDRFGMLVDIDSAAARITV